RENLEEVEADTEAAFAKRRELVKLLVERIVASRDEEGRPKVDITYRFGPPVEEGTGRCVDGERNPVEFTARNVVEDEEAFAELERMGTMSTPVTVIGGEEVVVGFERKKLERLLRL
ncbi:MAG TPA: hypothetical protein VFE09_05370, partial [Rubrobacteraceae bacterium]|nr:hypothetical protein [Rubrobacteraceae bacterium]